MGRAKNKLALFRKYKENLELLSEDPFYRSSNLQEIVAQDIVFCPICCRPFTEAQVLKHDDGDYLTIDHIPPRSLGGTAELLTCFECNNTASEFDKELQFFTHKSDSGIINMLTKLKVDGLRFGARTIYDVAKKDFTFLLSSEADLLKFIESQNGKAFDVEIKDKSKGVGVNLLKIAYLLAFNKFGYGIILHPQYNFIRRQIKEPYAKVLDHNGIFIFKELESMPDGIFVVTEPREFISLLVRFPVKSKKGSICRYSVFLPSPLGNVVNFYNALRTMPKDARFTFTKLFDVDYWHNPDYILAPVRDIEHLRGSRYSRVVKT